MIQVEKINKFLIISALVLTGLALLVFLSSFLTGRGEKPLNAREEAVGSEKINLASFTTDKITYGSQEKIDFLLELNSEKNQEVNLAINGIKPYKTAYLNINENRNLKKGKNTLSFSAQTPKCTSGCAGVNPGWYDVNLEIKNLNQNLLVSSAIKIELISR